MKGNCQSYKRGDYMLENKATILVVDDDPIDLKSTE